MNKIFVSLATMLLIVSCQTEPKGLAVSVGGEVESLINVTIPETRAASAEGIFSNVNLGNEDDGNTIRYILKIYQKVGDQYVASTDRQVEYSDGKNVVFPVRLVPGRDYKFVVWADFVTSKDDTDNHYNTKSEGELSNITLIGEWKAMDETRDAFTGVELVEHYSGSSVINVELTRPFAKLRVQTTDMKSLDDLGIVPTSAAVSYTTTHRTSFNALTKEFGGGHLEVNHTYALENIGGYNIYGESFTADKFTLFADYFFASDPAVGQDVVKFVFTVYDQYGVEEANIIKSNTFNTDIAVRRNHLTTICGNILTEGNNIEVNIEDAFDNQTYIEDEPYYVEIWDGESIEEPVYNSTTETFTITNASQLAWLAAAVNGMLPQTYSVTADNFEGKTFELVHDIDLGNEPWTPIGITESRFKGVFDGKGHTIYNLTVSGVERAGFFAYVDGECTIKDVVFENVRIVSTRLAGGVVCVGDAATSVTLDGITISGQISGVTYAGGICHNVNNAIIKNCVNNASITAQRAAGIGSWVTTNTVIESVENNGDVTGSVGASGIAHGFAGSITGAVNRGVIQSSGEEPAAGIAGVQKAASTYEYCYNYGAVTTTEDNPNSSAAGILGQTPGSTATLSYCANYAAITAEQSYAAGIAYSLYGSVNASYCYNAGAVAGADGAGAIAPKAQFGVGDRASYCLNSGLITSLNGNVYQGSNNNVSNFYYNADQLLNVSDNSVVVADEALAYLNGGADANFFEMENGVIAVK